MEKAIEIKRRAQRCVQNGDLDGALAEYEKLVAGEDSDPYNFVLLADLLYKKGETGQASQRYLSAASAYERAGLYKNAIAVCKKMMRLSLAALEVLERLANLHALDGLATESALYSIQYADLLVAQNEIEKAIAALEKAYAVAPDNLKALEKLGEARVLLGENENAARTLHEVARLYERAGQIADADRCRRRAQKLMPGYTPEPSDGPAHPPAGAAPAAPASLPAPARAADEPDGIAAEESDEIGAAAPLELDDHRHAGAEPTTPTATSPAVSAGYMDEMGLSAGKKGDAGPPRLAVALSEPSGPAFDEAPEEPAPPAKSERGESPEAPGLKFPAAPKPSEKPAADEPPSLARVEKLLAEAQEFFRAGEREAASRSLAGAARAYEAIGRLDSAATIYRSLGKSAHATRDVLELWLGNCERRSDRAEAAQVACELGDRALNEGDADGALGWFERARSLDPGNDLATRRLQKLTPAPASGAVATATAAPPEPGEMIGAPEPGAESAGAEDGAKPGALPEAGRVEVAVGRGEAVTFDLGALIGEFQRGVDAQLSGDAQSHYDLGMAYREMGLLEQALESFRVAGQDPAYRDRVVEMIGRCLLDQGRFDDATQAFTEALAEPTVDPGQAVSVRYLLGLAHEAAGRSQAALAEFERVYAAQPSFPDVAQKIRVLRKALENL